LRRRPRYRWRNCSGGSHVFLVGRTRKEPNHATLHTPCGSLGGGDVGRCGSDWRPCAERSCQADRSPADLPESGRPAAPTLKHRPRQSSASTELERHRSGLEGQGDTIRTELRTEGWSRYPHEPEAASAAAAADLRNPAAQALYVPEVQAPGPDCESNESQD